ncbi:MAG: PAS domain-containing protein [Acidobacteria bacterium]|nr:PAS domain-containing protein [Acidobacteriota bacterium]
MGIKSLNDHRIEDDYKSLTRQNRAWVLLLFFGMLTILYLVINRQTSLLIKNQINNQLLNMVEENAKTIEIFLQDRESDLLSYTHMNISGISEVKNYTHSIEAFLKDKQWYDLILIADMEGAIVFSILSELSANISDRRYFQSAKEGKIFRSGIFYSDILDRPVMVLAFPIKNSQGRIVGVFAASINLEHFYSLLFDLRLGDTSELFLVDSNGYLLSPTRLGGVPLQDRGYSSEEKNPHIGERGIKTHFDYRGQQVLSAHMRIPGTEFILVSEVDSAEALRPVGKLKRLLLFAFLPLVVIAVLISYFYSRRLTSLFRNLTANLSAALAESRQKRVELDGINKKLEAEIKEKEHLTEELQLSEEYIRGLIDSISLAVVAVDDRACITHFNRETTTMFSDSRPEVGKPIGEVFLWFKNRDVEEAFQSALRTRDAQNIERKKIAIGQNLEYFNLFFFPISSAGETVTGISIVVENVTERKRLQEQMAEYEKFSALSQLAMGAAHEINNPLLGISSFLEILADETEDMEKKEEIRFVLENVYRISETIRGLLDFARPTPPQFIKINVNQLIEDTLSFIGHQPIFRRITIRKNLSQVFPQITADLSQIRQVLINIFINAAQAMPDGGTLTVVSSKVKYEEKIRIDISDTGSGIGPQDRAKIMNPFFTTKKNEGTGLGLSISHRYIKNHHGEITFESVENEGTTFTIRLPIRQTGRPVGDEKETVA